MDDLLKISLYKTFIFVFTAFPGAYNELQFASSTASNVEGHSWSGTVKNSDSDKTTPQSRDLSISNESLSKNITQCQYPDNIECSKLGGDCINWSMSWNCLYGSDVPVLCTVKPEVTNCQGDRNFTRMIKCRFCYQTEHWEHYCTETTDCLSVAAPRQTYTANCTVKDHILCLGRRHFYKQLNCNWTSGYRWSTALILSITLGGFGVDRFYLGLWRVGLGKLFSFGGLGVWTLVDVILIAVGYVGPGDGSLYIF